MIDTVRFTISAALRPGLNILSNLPAPWKAKACGDYTDDLLTQEIVLICEPIGLRVYGNASRLNAVEVSLPKILHGHNGRLIKNAEELETAFAYLEYILASLLTSLPPNTRLIPVGKERTPDCHYTRVDMPWQFTADVGVRMTLANARHDKIRSYPSSFKGGQTIHLKGSFLEICAYDKVREMKLIKEYPHEIDRVEFRVKNRALSEIYPFSDGTGYTHLTFAWCLETMRRIAEETHANLPPAGGNGIHQFIADLDSELPAKNILERYIVSQELKRETARKFKNRVEQLRRPVQHGRSFSELFPKGEWPVPIEVESPELEKAHSEWFAQYVQQSFLRQQTVKS